MIEKELEPYMKYIMNHFSCNEKIAETILKSSEKNGELEKIKRICTSSEKERKYNL